MKKKDIINLIKKDLNLDVSSNILNKIIKNEY